MKTFPFPTTAHAARSLGAAALVLGASLGLASLGLASLGLAAGQDEEAENRLSVVYEGERYFLTRQLDGEELRDLIAGNTLIFLHPQGEEQELHRENGGTINGWKGEESANSGFWQIEEDEVCWTYPAGNHCKPLFYTERENLYGQVPGWYDGPLAFIWEPGDSRGLMERPLRGNAI